MSLHQKPQQPSIQIMLPTPIHLCPISARATQIFTDSLPEQLLPCEQHSRVSQEGMKATNTTIRQDPTSKRMSPQCLGIFKLNNYALCTFS